jgi:hypothetical protein
MGEFTGTPEVTKRMDFQSDTEAPEQNVDTSTNASPDTEAAKGAEAAQAQGAQTSQQTSAEVEGDDKKPETETQTETEPEKPTEKKKTYATDVTGVECDDLVRIGSEKFPCFDVSQQEFYQNMQDGRRRLRFNNGSNCQKYMQGTKYNRPFFIRHTDDRGKTYVRKVK